MRKKLKDCTVAELKRYCIKRESMPTGCTRCKLFHKQKRSIDENTGRILISLAYCKMSIIPSSYDLQDIVLNIPKEEKWKAE